MNCQSIAPKKAELGLFIDSLSPDFIIGTETWLLPYISLSKFFTTEYTIYCKERLDGYIWQCFPGSQKFLQIISIVL